MKNSKLLVYKNRELLGHLDKQRQFILQMHSYPMPCPNCGTRQNVFEGIGVDIDDYRADGKTVNDKKAHCISCKRELEYVVPLFKTSPGGWKWALVSASKPADEEEDA